MQLSAAMWKIRSLIEKDNRGRSKYWSDDVGWTWQEMADAYTDDQKATMVLPKQAVWEAQEP